MYQEIRFVAWAASRILMEYQIVIDWHKVFCYTEYVRYG